VTISRNCEIGIDFAQIQLASVPAVLREMPAGKLTLRHSHDGLRNKDVYRAPRP
jgi:hypothetical protein